MTQEQLQVLQDFARVFGESMHFGRVDAQGGLYFKELDLADLDTEEWARVPLGKAYRVQMSKRASTAGVQLEVRTPEARVFAPGDVLWGPLVELEVRLRPESTATGTAVLQVSRRPGVYLEEGDAGLARQRSSYAQTYNTTDNAPTNGATAGVNMQSARWLRARVSSPAGSTILSGSLWLWLYDSTGALWGRRITAAGDLADAAGRRVWQSDDVFLPVGTDWAYLEVRDGEHSAGAGDFTVVLTAGG